MFRPSAVALTFVVTALLALSGVLAVGPASADAAQSVKTYKASHRTGSLVAYKLHGVNAKGIRRARLSTKNRWQKLSLRRVRRGVKRGIFVARVSRKLLKPGKTATTTAPPAAPVTGTTETVTAPVADTTPKLVIVQENGTVAVSNPVPPPPAPVQPVPEAPAPAPGACTFGTFDVGNWPGACWRPYGPESPFNQKLPENPRLVGNSSQIVERITGFGPLENFTAGSAGTERDSGDPVYWSRATDPEYTIHCYEDWGTCEVEGMKVRIPEQARAAGGSDGHMTVIDQATGWEYDFWNVEMAPPAGGGQLDIGWGGRTRVAEGDGLDSSATAAGFGNLAGKLRAEELQAGRIDHALFLAIRCSNGQVVYPVVPKHGHAGQRCSQVGMSEENAPPMGTRLQLDMTLEEIEALPLAGWKKTILRALREYGAIMGDTGSNWAIATESGATYSSFGHADPWVEFAKSAGVEYYAPHDVYVFRMRNDVDWRSRLRVVDPCVSQRTC